MDGPDEESIKLYMRYIVALQKITQLSATTSSIDLAAHSAYELMSNDTSFGRMRRNAFINATINFNKVVLAKINPSFPGVDLIDLAEKVRLQVVIDRLDGDE